MQIFKLRLTVLAKTITVCVLIFAFASLLPISLGITSPAAGIKFVQSNK